MTTSTTATKKQTYSSPLWYVLTVGGTMALGFIAGILSGSKMGFTGYVRPALTPPDTAFAIIWPVLYFMIGNSLYFTLNSMPAHNKKTVYVAAITLWFVQLALNLAWPFLFFALDLKTIAFIELTILDAVVLALIILNFMISKPSAWLLIPYALWIAFATYLNVVIALFN